METKEIKAQNTNEKTQVFNVVILDKSGSMSIIRKNAVDGFNETLAGVRIAQEKFKDTQEHFITLAAFCGCGVTKIYDKVPVNEVTNLELEQYNPCCMTPLYDAIGITVSDIKKKTKDVDNFAVLVTVITDGAENASNEWTAPAIKTLIEGLTADGWMFSFIGTDNIIHVANDLSFKNHMIWEQTHEGTKEMFDTENISRNAFYKKMNDCSFASCDKATRTKMLKKFSKEFYEK